MEILNTHSINIQWNNGISIVWNIKRIIYYCREYWIYNHLKFNETFIVLLRLEYIDFSTRKISLASFINNYIHQRTYKYIYK